jgi:hypothetical protein
MAAPGTCLKVDGAPDSHERCAVHKQIEIDEWFLPRYPPNRFGRRVRRFLFTDDFWGVFSKSSLGVLSPSWRRHAGAPQRFVPSTCGGGSAHRRMPLRGGPLQRSR